MFKLLINMNTQTTIVKEVVKQITNYEPKMENRFVVKFESPFDEIPEYVVKKASRPKYILSTSHNKWENISLELYDPVFPSTSSAIINGLRKLRQQDSHHITFYISVMGPIGDIVEKWKIVGEVNTIDFGELDWKSDLPIYITIDFKIHSAILEF